MGARVRARSRRPTPTAVRTSLPISTVLDLDRLVFATETDTQKVRNIDADPNVAISPSTSTTKIGPS